MEQTVLIPITKIVDNPYQHREQENPADVQEIAISIAQHGLQQYPAVRAVNGHYELIFGHTRTAAYRLLATAGVPSADIKADKKYAQIPAYVRELTDRQMFELAVVENIKRRDPKPIEKAKAIQKYMTEFSATSKEAGELFGMNDATARGMVRLLDLPTAVQQKLDDGTITQGTARMFHSLQKVASEAVIVKTLKEIEQGKELPEDVIENNIERLDNVIDMWNDHHRDGKPRAGHHGWLLDMKNFPNKLLEHLAPGDYVELGLVKIVQLTTIHTDYSLGDKDADLPADLKAKIDHLSNPPACTACPFYTKIRGSHYCGVKACYQRKTAAWNIQQLEQTSKSTGIPFYTEDDGRYVLLLSHDDKCNALFAKKHAGLRLIPKSKISGYNYQSFKGIDDDVCYLVATGDAIEKLGTTYGEKGASGGKKTEKEKAEMRALKLYRARRMELMWECTGVAKSMFDAMPRNVLDRICEWHFIGMDDRIPKGYEPAENAKADVKAEFQRRALVWRLIKEGSSHFRRETMASILEDLVEHTGVKPPKALVKQAEQWDAEITAVAKGVAVETVNAKK